MVCFGVPLAHQPPWLPLLKHPCFQVEEGLPVECLGDYHTEGRHSGSEGPDGGRTPCYKVERLVLTPSHTPCGGTCNMMEHGSIPAQASIMSIPSKAASSATLSILFSLRVDISDIYIFIYYILYIYIHFEHVQLLSCLSACPWFRLFEESRLTCLEERDKRDPIRPTDPIVRFGPVGWSEDAQ